MEWKPNAMTKAEMEKKQAEYVKKAMDMAKKSPAPDSGDSWKKTEPKLKKEEKEPLNSDKIFHINKEEPQKPKQPEPAPQKQPEPAPRKQPEPVPQKQPEPAPQKQPERGIISDIISELKPGIISGIKKELKPEPVPRAETKPIQPHQQYQQYQQAQRKPAPKPENIEINAEINLTGILTEQEIVYLKPEREIPEKVRNYENNGQESCPPDFAAFISEHNRQVDRQVEHKHDGGDEKCNVCGSRRGENQNCRNCRNFQSTRSCRTGQGEQGYNQCTSKKNLI